MSSITVYSALYGEKIANVGSVTGSALEAWGLFPGNASVSISVPNPYIMIMQGVMPTDLSLFVTPKFRASDQLVIFGTGAGRIPTGSNDFLITHNAFNEFTLSTTSQDSTQAGTATWFLAETEINGQIICQFAGTVGGINSGAELEISNTNIVLGQQYYVSSLKLKFPYTWSF